jgi:hypothetical protein
VTQQVMCAHTYSTATTLHQGMPCGKQVMSVMVHAAPGCQEAIVLTLVHAACVLLTTLHLWLGAHQRGASGRAWDGGPVVAQPPVAVLPVTPAYISTGKTSDYNLQHKARLLLACCWAQCACCTGHAGMLAGATAISANAQYLRYTSSGPAEMTAAL